MCVEIPVDTPPVNLYYLDDIEQLLHRRCAKSIALGNTACWGHPNCHKNLPLSHDSSSWCLISIAFIF